MQKQRIRTRKKVKDRCPFCKSSQIHYRKILNNWICDEKATCGKVFKHPLGDV